MEFLRVMCINCRGELITMLTTYPVVDSVDSNGNYEQDKFIEWNELTNESLFSYLLLMNWKKHSSDWLL